MSYFMNTVVRIPFALNYVGMRFLVFWGIDVNDAFDLEGRSYFNIFLIDSCEELT